MALPWFKVSPEIGGHPQVEQLAALLEIPDAGGIILRLFCWVSTYAPLGIITPEQLPAMASFVTLVSRVTAKDPVPALIESGWLCKSRGKRGKTVVHNWRDMQGSLVTLTRQNRERQRRHRAGHGSVTRDVTRMSRDKKEKEKEKEKDLTAKAVALSEKQKLTAKDLPRLKTAAGSLVPMGAKTWEAYALAYASKYQAAPVRNAKTNSLCAQLVKRLGADDAPLVAGYYVSSKNGYYAQRGHALEPLVRDAEKLRTEWATGRQITQTEARQADQTSANLDGWLAMKRETKP